MMKMRMKEWFINKNFNQQQAQAIRNGYDLEVLRETEKAYQVNINTDFGKIRSWIPKSVISNGEELEQSNDFFELGKEVEHKRFGKGVVAEVDSYYVEVKFGNETKKMLKERKFFK